MIRKYIRNICRKFIYGDKAWLYLFVYGIGACDTSSFFSSPFYDMYGYMNYRQLSSSMTVLQNGYIGLVIYFAFLYTCSSWGCLKV